MLRRSSGTTKAVAPSTYSGDAIKASLVMETGAYLRTAQTANSAKSVGRFGGLA